MLSLEQVKMMVIAAELGSFSACARKMGKVQSAVSHGISTLEIDLGVELFDRTSRNPKLTVAGERLIRSARNLIAQADEFEKIAQSIEKKEESSLTIAIDDGVMNDKLAELFKRLDEQFPSTQIDVLTMASTDICQEITSNTVDLGVMFTELDMTKEVDFCYIGSVDYIAVCHPLYPLSKMDIELPSDLSAYRQIAVRGRLKQESHNLTSISPKVWWSSSHYNVLELVKQQVGWAYLPLSLVDGLVSQGQLIKISIAFDHKAWNVPVDLVCNKGKDKGPVFQWLFDELKTIFN